MLIEKEIKTEFEPNKEQKECIEFKTGITLALAGPGTGKTFCITKRIESLIRNNVQPDRILCLTFTEVAALEMKKRLSKTLEKKAATDVNVYTYHGLCMDIIQSNEFEFSFKDVKIINDITSYYFIKECIDEIEPTEYRDSNNDPYSKIPVLLEEISQIKKNMLTKEKYFYNIKNHPEWERMLKEKIRERDEKLNSGKKVTKQLESTIKKLDEKIRKAKELWRFYELYNSKMKKNNFVDFNDMISLVVQKFEENPSFLEQIASKYDQILIDEYQDTSRLQNKIIFFLIDGMKRKNVFLVGDDNQTIFSFQGANINNLANFIKKYQNELGFKVVCLKENMRSTQSILDFSYAVSNNDPLRLEGINEFKKFNIDKKLISKNTLLKDKDSPVKYIQYCSSEREQNAIVEKIENIINSPFCPLDERSEKKLSEIAILLKTNKEIDNYAMKLKAKNIPYELKEGKSIFNVKSSCVAYSYLKFLLNENIYENEILKLFLFEPFKIHSLDYEKIWIERHKNNQTLISEDIKKLIAEGKLKEPEKLKNFLDSYFELKEIVSSEDIRTVVLTAMEKSGIYRYFINCPVNKFENVQGLKKLTEITEEFYTSSFQNSLADFIDYLDLSRQNDFEIKTDKPQKTLNAVQLSTYHSSKGREFEYVFMPNLRKRLWESNSNPATASQNIPLDEVIDENEKKLYKYSNELKLMYVGLTRAKHSLYLSCAENVSLGLSDIISDKLDMTDSFFEQDSLELLEEDTKKELEVKSYDYDREFFEFLNSIIENIIYSPSAINNYIACPKKYLYQNILKLDSLSDPKDHANYGSSMHYCLERAFSFAKKEKNYPEKEKFYEWFKEKFDTLAISDKSIRKVMEQRAKENLETFYTYFIQTPVNRLYACEYKLDNTNIDGYNTTGFIDRIELNEDNTYTICDYKTGKKDKKNFKINGLNQDYLMQLYIYKMLFEKKNPDKKVTKLKIILPDSAFDSFEIEILESAEVFFKDLFVKACLDISKQKFEPKKDKKVCKYCSYKSVCESFIM